MFKQLLQASALQFVQIDSCRVGSVNENLAVMLMAHKFQGKKKIKKNVCIIIFRKEQRTVNYSGRLTSLDVYILSSELVPLDLVGGGHRVRSASPGATRN